MGIEGYFLVLVSILVVGFLLVIVLLVRRRRRSALSVLVATLVVGAVWYSLILVDRVANVLFFPDDTIYASRYSDEAFREVGMGQGPQKVLALLGEPLDRSASWDGEEEYWYYSRHGPRYDNYWNKIVIFNAHTGKVTEKVDELYSE